MGTALDRAMQDPEGQKKKLDELDKEREVEAAEQAKEAMEIERLLSVLPTQEREAVPVTIGDQIVIEVFCTLDGRTEQLLASITYEGQLMQQGEGDVKGYMDQVYETMARLCVPLDGKPWSKPETWKKIHGERTFLGLSEIFDQLSKPSLSALEAAKSFRDEPKR